MLGICVCEIGQWYHYVRLYIYHLVINRVLIIIEVWI